MSVGPGVSEILTHRAQVRRGLRQPPCRLKPATAKAPATGQRLQRASSAPGQAGWAATRRMRMGSHGGHFQGSLFGHPVQVVHGLAAADCLNSRKHHAYALWGWASPHSRVSTPRARCLSLPAMWVTCRFNWPFGTRSHRGRVFTDVSRIPFCRHTLENTFIKSTPRFSHRPCRPPLPLSRYYASHCLRRNCTYPGR